MVKVEYSFGERHVNGHPSKWIQVNGKRMHIDNKLVVLIKALNGVGLRTTQCCQGDSKKHGNGARCRPYISVSLEGLDVVFHGKENRFVIYWDKVGRVK
jgi:hypothetical protein